MPTKKPKKVKLKPKKPTPLKYTKEAVKENKLLEFTASVKPYQILEEDKELERLRTEYKADEQNKVLLEKELEKPLNSRNQTLIKKYAARIDESYAWPDVFSKKYDVIAYAPDDGNVKVEDRPLPYYANVEYKVGDSKVLYKFPISKYLDNGGESYYKIDLTNTVIDSAGNVSEYSSEEITPYIILKKFDAGDLELAEQYNTPNGYFFNFPGFRVKSKVVTEEKKKEAQVKNKNKTLQQFKIAKDANWAVSGGRKIITPELQRKITNRLKEGVFMGQNVPLVKDSNVFIDNYILSTSTNWWVIYYHYEKFDGNKKLLFGCYVEGVSAAFELISEIDSKAKRSDFKSVEYANISIAKWNKAMVEDFQKFR